MPWRVKTAIWLKVETDRVEEIILLPRYWGRSWTPRSLKEELRKTQGLFYSLPEINQINGELHTRGVVEDV